VPVKNDKKAALHHQIPQGRPKLSGVHKVSQKDLRGGIRALHKPDPVIRPKSDKLVGVRVLPCLDQSGDERYYETSRTCTSTPRGGQNATDVRSANYSHVTLDKREVELVQLTKRTVRVVDVDPAGPHARTLERPLLTFGGVRASLPSLGSVVCSVLGVLSLFSGVIFYFVACVALPCDHEEQKVIAGRALWVTVLSVIAFALATALRALSKKEPKFEIKEDEDELVAEGLTAPTVVFTYCPNLLASLLLECRNSHDCLESAGRQTLLRLMAPLGIPAELAPAVMEGTLAAALLMVERGFQERLPLWGGGPVCEERTGLRAWSKSGGSPRGTSSGNP
jgi:hypothetical protein